VKFGKYVLGLYLTFVTPRNIEESISILNSTFQNFNLSIPILISANVLSSSTAKSDSSDLIEGEDFLQLLDDLLPSGIPILGWSTFYGMDPIWSRMRRESILQEFQTKRIIKVIDQLYENGEQIPQEDARFVELLQRKLERSNLNSFTELAVGQLYKAIELNGFHVLETEKLVKKYYDPRKRSRMEPVREILTDLYMNTNRYEEEDVTKMIKIIQNRKNIGISLRAGMVPNGSNNRILQRLLDEIQGSFLALERLPGDRESFEDISSILETFRENSFYVGFSQAQANIARISKPKEFTENNASTGINQKKLLYLMHILLVFIFAM